LNEGLRGNQGFDRKLTLISAPAGYGKTTLVSRWIDNLKRTGNEQSVAHVAWLSLDEDDNDPQQLFNYLAATIKPFPDVHPFLPQLLQSPQPLPAKELMKVFISDLTAVSGLTLLVLDDYHLIESLEIDEAMAFLLDHTPPNLHLVIITRSDPSFPISRLRARDQLTEVRLGDLRFTEEEAASFLKDTMHITVSPAQVSALENRTEGWIAGLQMAALSMQNRADIDEFITSFTGSHRFVLDYLVEEALGQQSEAVHTFLLATSILDRLNGPLCEAVSGQTSGQQFLERLDRDNLFVIPLDDERHWYRYHHLFKDVLQAYAATNYPEQIITWHQRASDWFARQGATFDAIRHALAANNFNQAATLMEIIHPTIDGIHQFEMWSRWAQALPDAVIHKRPALSMSYAWVLLEAGKIAESEAYRSIAENWLKASSPDMIIADETQWKTLPASLSAARAYAALALGDVAEAIPHAQAAIDFFDDEDHRWRGVGLALLALTFWMKGDLAASIEAFTNNLQGLIKINKWVDAISVAFTLAEMQIAQGDLNQAEQTIQQSLTLAKSQGEPPLLGTSDLYRVGAYLAWERGDQETAEHHLIMAADLGKQAAFANWPYRLYLTQAQMEQGRSNFAEALARLAEAESAYIETPIPMTRSISALRANLWIVEGDLDKAQNRVRQQTVAATDELSYLREFDHITLARLFLAQYQQTRNAQLLEEATQLLTRLLTAAEAANRWGSVLDILTLQALLHAADNDISAALTPLGRALTLAEPHGYVRHFVDEGPLMVTLLQAAHKAGIASPYVSRLLTELNEAEHKTAKAAQPLIDPLSERELEILALIAAGLKNKEIADQLFISLNTVLYHIKNIYGKLGVNKRALAISKAKDLGLL
ncbi:MAG: LuxR C-terminal-related transcriptional regulator, partial [Chloroflexota bacterium]